VKFDEANEAADIYAATHETIAKLHRRAEWRGSQSGSVEWSSGVEFHEGRGAVGYRVVFDVYEDNGPDHLRVTVMFSPQRGTRRTVVGDLLLLAHVDDIRQRVESALEAWRCGVGDWPEPADLGLAAAPAHPHFTHFDD
jgi:hypothetical protein